MFIVSHTVFFPIIIIISIIYHARMSCIYFWEALSEKTPNRILNYISVARTFYCSIGNYNIFFTAGSRRQIDHDKCWPNVGQSTQHWDVIGSPGVVQKQLDAVFSKGLPYTFINIIPQTDIIAIDRIEICVMVYWK